MPSCHGVEDSNRWCWVDGDTCAHGESRSPSQICQQNLLLDFHTVWPCEYMHECECKYDHQYMVIIHVLDIHSSDG